MLVFSPVQSARAHKTRNQKAAFAVDGKITYSPSLPLCHAASALFRPNTGMRVQVCVRPNVNKPREAVLLVFSVIV